MGKYFITGSQGSGKTTLVNRLKDRGFNAYDIESMPGVMGLENLVTGEFIDWPKGPVDWTTYGWNMQEEPINALLRANDTVFLAAVTSNQDKFYYKFDKIFMLEVDEAILRRHLPQSEHESHRDPEQIEKLISWHADEQKQMINAGAIPIKGGRNVDAIIDELLTYTDITLNSMV